MSAPPARPPGLEPNPYEPPRAPVNRTRPVGLGPAAGLRRVLVALAVGVAGLVVFEVVAVLIVVMIPTPGRFARWPSVAAAVAAGSAASWGVARWLGRHGRRRAARGG